MCWLMDEWSDVSERISMMEEMGGCEFEIEFLIKYLTMIDEEIKKKECKK